MYIVLVFLIMPLIICPIATSRIKAKWWRMTVDGVGFHVHRGGFGKRRDRDVTWEQITRIGPFEDGTASYLAAWSTTEVVVLCPLGSTDFPSERIRAAIAQFRPTAPVDPYF